MMCRRRRVFLFLSQDKAGSAEQVCACLQENLSRQEKDVEMQTLNGIFEPLGI